MKYEIKNLKASFTIEAAIIVPLTMFVIAAFLYMTFYIHDKVIIKTTGVNYILENAANYTESQDEIADKTEQMLSARLIIASDVNVKVTEDNGVFLESSADFNIPFEFVLNIMGTEPEDVTGSVNVSMLDGRETLLKYKAAADGIDFLTGDE